MATVVVEFIEDDRVDGKMEERFQSPDDARARAEDLSVRLTKAGMNFRLSCLTSDRKDIPFRSADGTISALKPDTESLAVYLGDIEDQYRAANLK